MTAAFASPLVIAFLAVQVPVPPRDAPTPRQRTGTAIIRGHVVAGDSGLPMSRATVMVMPAYPPPMPPPGAVQGQPLPPEYMALVPRNTLTDAAGRFELAALPAGAYRLRVQPSSFSSQYLSAAYGAKSRSDPGQIITVGDGESFDRADVQLERGGTISGRVVDDQGVPLVRVSVFPMRRVPGSPTFQRVGGGFLQSDDHGRYRIYGLEPGDYVVAAEARGSSGPQVEGIEAEGYAQTFHPSTLVDRDAAPIRVRASGEVEGIDVVLIRTRTFRISGSVVDSKGNLATRSSVQLVRGSNGFFNSLGGMSSSDGKFTFRDVTPGDYTLVVNPMRDGPRAIEPGTNGPPAEYASLSISVNADMDNLVLTSQPGATLTGQVVFEGGAQGSTAGIRVSAQAAERIFMVGPPPNAQVGSDGRFTLTELATPSLLRVLLPKREWAVKAVMLGPTDITDTPVDFMKLRNATVQVLVSTRAGSIDGTVTGDDGKPVRDANVLVFPEDESSWSFLSPRLRRGTWAADGKFLVTGLVGGRYYIAAYPPGAVAIGPYADRDTFERVVKDAIRVVVSDDERRTVDLRLSKPPE